MALVRSHLFPSCGSLGTTDPRLGGSLALPILAERHALPRHVLPHDDRERPYREK